MPARRLFEVERAPLPRVDQADDQDGDEDGGFDETEHAELAQLHRPRVEKHNLDVEDKEQQRGQVKANREAVPRRPARRIATLEGLAFHFLMWRSWAGQ